MIETGLTGWLGRCEGDDDARAVGECQCAIRNGVTQMRKPASPLIGATLASMFTVLASGAVAQAPGVSVPQPQPQDHRQDRRPGPPHNQPGAMQPGQPRHFGPVGAGPGAMQPGPQGPRNLGPAVARPPGAQPGQYAHGQMPFHEYGGRRYHGRLAWERGHWRHEWHNGRLGWWWDVDGAWYFYSEPTDGPPAYVSDVEAVDEADEGPDGPPVVGQDGPPAAEGYPPPVVEGYPPPPPPPPAPGQETVGGAIGGAILGGLIGGAVSGRAGGAAAGALIGGATGAIIGSEAEQRRGYYWWHGGCYYRYPSGEYQQVGPRYCQ